MARMELEEKFRGARLGGALDDAIGELAFRLGDRAALTAAIDLGVDAIPAERLAKLENRDLLDALARRLAAAGERRAARLNG